MRRKDKETTDPRIIDNVLSTASICRLAMVDRGELYLIPVNYGYRDGALYVHSASAGRKIDVLCRHPRVCFEIESPAVITQHAEPATGEPRRGASLDMVRLKSFRTPNKEGTVWTS